MIFDDIPRNDRRPMRAGESEFAFWNRMAGPVATRVRTILEEWFSHYPSAHREEWRGLFRSERPEQHRAAIWELYLHESLIRCGWNVAVHPATAGGQRPDFRATRGSDAFYLEASSCFLDFVPSAVESRRREVYEALESVNSPNFWLNVHFNQETSAPPRRKPLARDVEAWLSSLDVDELFAEQLAGNHHHTARVFGVGGWLVSITVIAKSPELRRDPSGKSLGFLHGDAGFYDARSPIRNKLNDKARRYGLLDAPLVLALALDGMLFDRESLTEALFGTTQVSVPIGPTGPGVATSTRRRDGFFVDESPRALQVSAVVVGKGLHPAGLARAEVTTWHHPWGAVPLPFNLPWPEVRLDPVEGALVEADAYTVSPEMLLGLPPEWPGPDALFADE